jgi:hypothetical protein
LTSLVIVSLQYASIEEIEDQGHYWTTQASAKASTGMIHSMEQVQPPSASVLMKGDDRFYAAAK